MKRLLFLLLPILILTSCKDDTILFLNGDIEGKWSVYDYKLYKNEEIVEHKIGIDSLVLSDTILINDTVFCNDSILIENTIIINNALIRTSELYICFYKSGEYASNFLGLGTYIVNNDRTEITLWSDTKESRSWVLHKIDSSNIQIHQYYTKKDEKEEVDIYKELYILQKQ